MVLHPFLQSLDARGWKETPCHILSSEVKTYHGKNGPTYGVEISYAYKVAAQEYHSNRYQFLRFSNGDRQPKAEMVGRYPRGKQAVCFVDPKNPSEAVLDRRSATVGLFGLLPLVFVGVGAVGVVRAVRGGNNSALAKALQEGTPWLARPDWAAGRVVSSAKNTLRSAWFFAVFWNAIAFPVAWSVLSQHVIRKGNYAPAIALIFPLIGLGLLCWALRLTRRWVCFGESVFEMTAVPGIIGGTLEGTIRLSRPIRPEGPVHLRLKCLSRTTTRNGDGSSTNESLLWQHEETADLDGIDAIPVAFRIPGDTEPTTVIGAGNGILWRLEVQARVPGMDYAAPFEVPVFEGELSLEEQAEAERLQAREQAAIAVYAPPPSSRIRVQMALRGGTEFYFPAGRNLGASLLPAAILLVLLSLLWVAFQSHWPLPPKLAFLFFSLILAFVVAHAWTATTRVLVQREGITVTKTLLGLARIQTVAAEEIAEIKPVIGSTMGSTAFYDLHLTCRNDQCITIGKAIPDEREAEWLAAQMTQALRAN